MKPYRILITGSRTWDDRDTIWRELGNTVAPIPVDREITVVHGHCPRGADAMADEWARKYGATVERHPANWRPGGVLDRAAGFRRNAEMVALGADICLAFIKDRSRGASHAAGLAAGAGIPVRRWIA
ncbi:DUF2493 domain-containing protein [Streptomyces sp. NPDC005799]|uniref:DUF2493 domain-containing protein n=1 Tax=Streptomyces sp. NPDC005799 TaxID=3154678 RepID=UPI003401E99D